MRECPVTVLKVLHVPVRLILENLAETEAKYGEYNSRSKTIRCDLKQMTGQTMVHEVSHAIKDAANMELTDDKKDEDNSMSLECLVATFIADNPEFCRWLVDKITESFNGVGARCACGAKRDEAGEPPGSSGFYTNT